jgi:hypothetical protein
MAKSPPLMFTVLGKPVKQSVQLTAQKEGKEPLLALQVNLNDLQPAIYIIYIIYIINLND